MHDTTHPLPARPAACCLQAPAAPAPSAALQLPAGWFGPLGQDANHSAALDVPSLSFLCFYLPSLTCPTPRHAHETPPNTTPPQVPQCRLYTADTICCQGEGIITGKPWLNVQLLCSENTLLPKKCLTIEGGCDVAPCAGLGAERAVAPVPLRCALRPALLCHLVSAAGGGSLGGGWECAVSRDWSRHGSCTTGTVAQLPSHPPAPLTYASTHPSTRLPRTHPPHTAGPTNVTVTPVYNEGRNQAFRWLLSWSTDPLYPTFNGTVRVSINRCV